MFHVKSSLLPRAERRYVLKIEAAPDNSNGPQTSIVCHSRWFRRLRSSFLNRVTNEYWWLLLVARNMNCHSSNPARYVKVKSIVVLNPVRVSPIQFTELERLTTLNVAHHCLYGGLLTNDRAIIG